VLGYVHKGPLDTRTRSRLINGVVVSQEFLLLKRVILLPNPAMMPRPSGRGDVPSEVKLPSKAAAKKTIITNKRSIEIIDLTASPRRRKRLKLTYFSDLSSDREINEEAIDDITEEAAKEVIEEVNDDVPFELVDDVDYGGNAKVIESPVRPRRSERERQATRRSLNYHKKMRKGR
jgi:hypothetical protein